MNIYIYIYIYIYSVVICAGLLGKVAHRQVGVGTVVTSASLCGVMVSTLSSNVIDLGSIPALGTIYFPFSSQL